MKKLFLLLVLMLSVASSVSAVDVEIDGLWYSLSGTTAEVIQYKDNVKYSGDIVIPSTVSFNNTEYNVTSIGNSAFSGCGWGLKSVTIPNSVKTIGNYAFNKCYALISVTIPNSVTSIGDYAFYGISNLMSVTIPSSVTSIGISAFSGCSGLTKVTINSNSIASISYTGESSMKQSFGNQVKTYILGDGVMRIGDGAFHYCTGLTSITIPNSVTSIGNYAFSGCSGLTSITIPNSVTSIGQRVFENCTGLTTPVYNATLFCFLPSSYEGSFDIPDGLTSIISDSFSGCSGLTSITIPNSVTSIKDHAFDGCSGLKSITIPNGVTSIEKYTFSVCSGLTSITIPSSVTSIGGSAFGDCSSLTDVYCYAKNVPTTNSYAFFGTSKSNVTLHVPVVSVDAYKAVAPWKDFKEVVALTDQETGIDVVSGDSDTEVARYTMGGQRVYRYAKGLNIIRMSNGKTKKMVVK